MLQVAFFTHICRAVSSIFAIIFMSTHESFEMLRVCFSYKNTSLCLTCRGGQGRAELGLQCRPSFVHQTGARADYRPRNCPLRYWRERAGLSMHRPTSRLLIAQPRPGVSHTVCLSSLAHRAFQLGVIQHTVYLGHFAKARVCFYVKRSTFPHFRVASLIKFLKVESYFGKKTSRDKGLMPKR